MDARVSVLGVVNGMIISTGFTFSSESPLRYFLTQLDQQNYFGSFHNRFCYGSVRRIVKIV